MISHNSMWLFCSILCEHHTNPTHIGVNSFLRHPIPPLPLPPSPHTSITPSLLPIPSSPHPPLSHTFITPYHYPIHPLLILLLLHPSTIPYLHNLITHTPLSCALTTAGLATAHIHTEYHRDNHQDGYDREGDPQGGAKVQCPQVRGGLCGDEGSSAGCDGDVCDCGGGIYNT